MTVDVAVIGAGLAGLACAQRLRQLGLQVVVVEKSRGLGGRLATRRWSDGHADHGVRYLENQGQLSQALIQALCDRGILHRWIDRVYELSHLGNLHPSPAVYPRYAATNGITAVAKFLGSGLEIWRSQRVQNITPCSDRTWALTLEANGVDVKPELTAKALVITIPAPQALALLEPLAEHGLPPELLARLRSVSFAPCITAIASYAAARQIETANLAWQAITCSEDPDLAWIAMDSSKQCQPHRPAVIVQSTAAFAQMHLEAPNLQTVGEQLLHRVAQLSQPWLAQPETLQVHRWRYAFAVIPLTETSLNTLHPLPLSCGGDWCGGATIDAALQSGLQCAAQIAGGLAQNPDPEALETITIWTGVLKQIASDL